MFNVNFIKQNQNIQSNQLCCEVSSSSKKTLNFLKDGLLIISFDLTFYSN